MPTSMVEHFWLALPLQSHMVTEAEDSLANCRDRSMYLLLSRLLIAPLFATCYCCFLPPLHDHKTAFAPLFM